MSQYVTKIRTDAGDLQIDYNALANLPELNTMFSNPNLLINSDFRNPINQRGQTSYTGGGIYSIDRWMLGNSATLTVQDGSIKFEQSSGATNTGRLVYRFENALPANYYTISVKVLSCNGGASMDDFGTIADGFTGVFTATTTSEKELSSLRFYIAAGRSLEIEWIKLEQGTVATPFVPRLYDEELMLCKRYYQNINLYFRPGVVDYDGTTIVFVADTDFRSTPSITMSITPPSLRTAAVNSVSTTITYNNVYYSDGLCMLFFTSSEDLGARNVVWSCNAFKVIADAEIY